MDYEKPFLYIDTNFAPDEALMTYLAFKSFDFEIVGMSSSEGMMVSIGESFSDYHHLDEKVFITTKDYVEDLPAYENIIEKASDCGKLDIIATSGLTNIAKALDEAPEIEDFISHVFILGGETEDKVSETFIKDPKSVDSSIDLFLLPVEACNKVHLSYEMINSLYGKDKNLDIILDEFKKERNESRPLCAPLLMYLMLVPEAFIFEESGFGIITSDEEGKLGSLYRTDARKKNYRVTRFNEDSFYDFIMGSLK